jgi:hypothetical protein
MSHITTIKTEIRDLQTLTQTLTLLGLEFSENGNTRGHLKEKVDLAVKLNGGVRFGFKKTGQKECYEIKGLSEVLHDAKTRKVINQIKQEYAYQKILFETRRRGFALVQEERVKPGTIRMVLRKVA